MPRKDEPTPVGHFARRFATGGATGFSKRKRGCIFGGGTPNLSLLGCQILHNQADGGDAGDGGSDGQGIGGGVYNLGTFTFDVTTIIAHNHASTSNDDTFGV